MTRKQFEEMNKDLFERVKVPVNEAIRVSKLSNLSKDITDIVLVGGSTRMPKIVGIMKEMFPQSKINKDINPDEAIAYGAACQAAKMGGDESEMLREMVLLDVSPMSLGIEAVGGIMSTVIARNTSLPASRSRKYATHKDRQTAVHIKVYEGEEPLTKDNNLLGNFRLTGITPTTVGKTEIDVTFSIDANGILNVSATEKTGSHSEKTVTISNNHGRFTDAELQDIIGRAAALRVDDDVRKQKTESRSKVQNLCTNMHDEVADPRVKNILSRSEIEKTLKACKDMLDWCDVNLNQPVDVYEAKYAQMEEKFAPIRRRLRGEDENEEVVEVPQMVKHVANG